MKWNIFLALIIGIISAIYGYFEYGNEGIAMGIVGAIVGSLIGQIIDKNS